MSFTKNRKTNSENSTKAKALLEEIQQVLDADDWNTKVQQESLTKAVD